MGAPERVAQRYVRNEQVTVSAATYDVVTMERASTLLVAYTATGTVKVTLKSAWIARDGNTLTIKDAGFNASLNNITVATEGAEQIEGSASDLIINVNGASVTLQTNGSNLFII